ncbi:MAG: (1-_4)-alpha-D-glucan 1-alpha-D-glucosylmutase [Actinomycetota bacterium]|nr:(1->4)-alpha-D-glucan 1-alpha-D-glucosylmutase [Actinomycetota bacterium]
MRTPLATYRLQLRPGFGFDEAAAVAPYLADLGVTHVYCSPYLQAVPGSSHGYDVVDHSKVSEDLGGAEAHARMVEAFERHGLGQVLDIVPNHMAIAGRSNRWWWDVLENGRASVYARYFDVDWDPPESKLRGRVLLPLLGDHYGRVLEAGEIAVVREDGGFVVRYHEHAAPVAPRSLDELLQRAAHRCGSAELETLAAEFGRLPPATSTDRASVEARHRDKEVLRTQLGRLLSEEPEVAAAVDAVVADLNRDPDAFDRMLERQNYRLAYWRTAQEELDYRRFFDIATLVGLRTEDELVFADTHALVLRWVRDGQLDGLRIDHPDGLRDPAAYLARLAEATGGAWVVVEKVLEPEERLRPSWPVAGTTGYDFLNRLGGLFVDPAGEAPLSALMAELTGEDPDWTATVRAKKDLVLREVLAADVHRIVEALARVCESNRRFRDYTRRELTEALREVIVAFPVYRSYAVAERGEVTDDDVAVVTAAIALAREWRPDIDAELLGFLEDLLLLRITGEVEGDLVMRFQQLTGPAMAKGVEDTAFYTFVRLVSLNEVGGDPSRFGVSVAAFHSANSAAAERWPGTMLATSTHDTKRSEDVRARISLLSEIPGHWTDTVRRWRTHNDRHRVDGRPDPGAEYLLYQTLVGAWPLDEERALAYMEKATKEAKTHTSWTDPNPAYDEAVATFVRAVYADVDFGIELEALVARLTEPGRTCGLAQQLLKLTSPGVPDVYQGTELWDLSLVDPDNRRPVDFDLRRRLLSEGAADIHPKLLVTQRALRLRRERPDLLGPGASYEPLHATGASADHAVAFIRGAGCAVVVPRLVLGLAARRWRDTTIALPAGDWRDELTGAEVGGGLVAVGELLDGFPVALLVRS